MAVSRVFYFHRPALWSLIKPAVFASLFFATMLLTGCGISLLKELNAPGVISASTDEVERITLFWAEVENANHYYIYRSLNSDGPFGPEPLQTVEGTSFTDSGISSGNYYYTVSASDALASVESPHSDVAHGTALSAPLQWRPPVLVGIGAGIVDVAVDYLTPGEPAYVLTAPSREDAEISVYHITSDTQLERVGPSFGAINGIAKRSAALAVAGGTLFVASTDDTGLADTTAEVILWRFDSGSGTWIIEPASASFSDAELTAPWIDLEARSPTDVYLAYRDRGLILDGPIAAYHFDGTVATDMAGALVVGGATQVTNIVLSVTAADETLIYKDDAGSGEIIEASVVGGVWQEVPIAISDPSDVIQNGYSHASFDPISGDLYVVYYDETDSELVVKQDGVRITPDPGIADAGTTSVAITSVAGQVMVFFATLSGSGTIRHYTGAAWETISPDPLTLGGSLSSLSMRATSTGLVIGYIEATLGTIRLFH